MYLIGNDICFKRLKNIGLNASGETANFVKTRQQWVDFLHQQKEKTDVWISDNRDAWMKIYEQDIKQNSISQASMEQKILQRLQRSKTEFI